MYNLIIDQQGSITSPKGFKATGVHCGIKKNGNPDLALVCSDTDAATAGVYTTNLVKGHSLQLTISRINKNKKSRAILINSGCANACVPGDQGLEDAKDITAYAGEQLDIDPEMILIGSTGVIGVGLPIDKMKAGILQGSRDISYNGGTDAAKAIMTTDTVKKECSVTLELSGQKVTIGGMAKGSGMIHPNMATMISVITTDANISQSLLQNILSEITDVTYNRVSVDGDTSVCDMCILMANGMAQNDMIVEKNNDYQLLHEGVQAVATYLSRLLAKDGEGATKLLNINVINGPTLKDVRLISSAIARSPLCKTAFFGEDANFGRVITAAGYSGAEFDPDKIDIYLEDMEMYKNGRACLFDEEEALKKLQKSEVSITVDLKSGTEKDLMWTCDFSYDYVKINGSYRS